MKCTKRRDAEVWLTASALFLAAFSVILYRISLLPPPLHYEAEPSVVRREENLKPETQHLPTPVPVKAIYMTQCVVADKELRSKLVALINETELNSVVIDIKDYSGRISFVPSDPLWSESVSRFCYASDMWDFIESLHREGIYVIGRITVFQDPYITSHHPELAVKKAPGEDAVWKDHKGISYVDPGAREFWDKIITLAHDAYDIGFDELNFDYIRFPSDGNMFDIHFPYSEEIIVADPEGGKSLILREFFSYLSRNLREEGITISADLFGMTTTNTDDLNIGQILEDVLPNFDYVAPMVYPSHYPTNFIGIANPAAEPYRVVRYSMDEAVRRASTTPWKIRPWLQDFSLGAVYTPGMVRAQIQAVYDSGLTSWMLWSASNRYTRGALDSE